MRLSQSAESAPPPRDPSRCAPRLPCPALSPSALPCHPLPCLVTLCPACAAPRPLANLAPRSHAPPRSSPWLRAEPRLHPSLAAATVSGLRVHPRGLSVCFPAAYHPSAVLFPFRVLLVFRFSVFVFCSSVVFRLLLSGPVPVVFSGCSLSLFGLLPLWWPCSVQSLRCVLPRPVVSVYPAT